MSATRRSILGRLYHFVVEADHLKQANKFLPWRYAFGCLCLVAVAAGLSGLFVHAQAYVLLLGVLVVLVVGTVWPWVCVRTLRAGLSYDQPRGREGEPVGARLTIVNYLPLGAWGLRVKGDVGKGATAEDGVTVSLAVAPGWRRTEFTWEIVPGCRGEYPTAAPHLVSGFPFGLWEASRPMHVDGRLLVWPKTFPVPSVPEAASNSRSREGTVPQNKTGHSGDILGLRPYRRGDARRRIHWPQTARHDRLIVRELQVTSSPRVQIVLDADSRVHRGGRPDGSREWAIRVAASLAEGLLDQGVYVEGVFGETVVSSEVGERQRTALLDALARLPDAAGPTLSEVLRRSVCRGFRDGLQLVIATDLGMASLPETSHPSGRRFVMLRASAFGGTESPPTLSVRPWVVLDDPARVAEQFQRGWRGVLCAT